MFFSSDVVVIDIGSRSISAYVAERLSDDSFALKESCGVEYDGYTEGRWNKPDDLLPSIFKVLDTLSRRSGKIKSLYVGIPADFCTVRTVYDKVTFFKPKRVVSSDLREVFDKNDPFAGSKFSCLHVESVCYWDDRDERLLNPLGVITSSLRISLSYVGADQRVLDQLEEGLIRYGVKKVRFVQSEYAAALALFTKEEREGGILLADIGYSATSLLHLSGDALLEMRTFALGGSMIPIGLSNSYSIPYRVAAAFVPKINLGYKDEGEYSLKYDASTYSYPISEVNDLAKESIRFLVGYLKKALDSFKFETSPRQTLYLTGGGFSEVRLSEEYLAKTLDRKVKTVLPDTPNFSRPYFSTTVGLIRFALAREKKDKLGFFKRLFNF